LIGLAWVFADSLKGRAAAADIMIQQFARSKELSSAEKLFPTRFLLGYYAFVEDLHGRRASKGLSDFGARPGYGRPKHIMTEGYMALALGKSGDHSLISLSWFCDDNQYDMITRISSTLA
jgi:hypothetical protein